MLFESSSKTSTKEHENCNIASPFTLRLKPRGRAVTAKYLTCSGYQPRLIGAHQGRMRDTKVTKTRGYLWYQFPGNSDQSVLSEVFFCTPNTLKVDVQGYQQQLQIRPIMLRHEKLTSLTLLGQFAVPEHMPELSHQVTRAHWICTACGGTD